MRQRVVRVERQAGAVTALELQLQRVVLRLALIEEDGDVATRWGKSRHTAGAAARRPGLQAPG